MAAYGSCGYVNINSEEHNATAGSHSRHLARLYGSNLPRLLEVKRRYDPTNLFHHNSNIREEETVITHSCIRPEPLNLSVETVPLSTSANANNHHTHMDTACDACGANPIVGVRFKCGNCSNYDLCASCEIKSSELHDEDHVFIKIVRPAKLNMHSLAHGFVPNLYKTGKTGLPSFDSSSPAKSVVYNADLPKLLSAGKAVLKSVSQRDISDLSSAIPTLRSPDRAMLTGASLADTLVNMFKHYAADRPERPCIGKKNGLSFSFLSYGQVLQRFLHIGAAIAELFLASSSLAHEGPHVVAIMASTSVDAVICDLACASQGISPIFLPFNVSSHAIAQLLSNLGCKTVICSNQSASLLSSALSTSVSCAVQNVISIDCSENALQLPHSITIQQLSDVEARGVVLSGSSSSPILHRQPRFSDLFTMIYTSGSSRLPKGAVRSCRQWHDLMVYFTQGVDSQRAEHVVCAYAPLCHIMERSNVWSCFSAGGSVGVFDRHASELLDDVKLLSPTVFAATPSVWNTLFAQYQQAIQKFRASLTSSSEQDITKLALASIAPALGSRLKSISTGGAVTSQEVLEFMRDCFNCEVADAYGITETGPVLVNGRPLPGVEIKLEDVPALGYFVNGQPSAGQLLVRTPNMASGYFNVEGAAFQRDGWYATGDIVQIGQGDSVLVIDRISNCFKLSHGEFISPEKVESAIISCSWIDQAYVYGDSFKNFVVAVVVLNDSMLYSRTSARQLLELSPESICSLHEEVASAVASTCASLLLPFELPKTYILLDSSEGFSAENRLLTSTLKLNRGALKRHFSARIGNAYASIESRYSELERMVKSLLPPSNDGNDGVQHCGDVGLSFVLLGGDSLSAIKFVNLIREQFGKQLSPDVLLHAKSLQDIYAYINRPGVDVSDVLSEADAVAQDRALPVPHCLLSNSNRIVTVDARNIFVTGATGFLGAHVLHDLLRYSRATIHCLVRQMPGDVSTPLQRIVDALNLFRLEPVDTTRISIVPGDLSLPLFGLLPPEFDRLAATIDCIFHVGAHVNWLLDYRSARARTS